MFLTQPLLHNLLHRFPWFRRLFHLWGWQNRRNGRSHSRRRWNDPSTGWCELRLTRTRCRRRGSRCRRCFGEHCWLFYFWWSNRRCRRRSQRRSRRRCYLRLGWRRFLNFSFNFGFSSGFNARRFRLDRDSLHRRLDDIIRRLLDGNDIVATSGGHLAGVGSVHAQFSPEPVGQTIFNRIGVRSHRHAHVLQFANDLGVVAIQLAGQLINTKLWHSFSSVL